MSPNLRRNLLAGYTGVVYLALLTPPLYIFLLAISPNPVPGQVASGFTTQWITGALGNAGLMEDLLVTAQIAFATAMLATPLGLLAARTYTALTGHRDTFLAFVLLPALVPGIVYGLSLSVLLRVSGLQTSMFTIILGELTWTLPFATLIILTALSSFDTQLREASSDLGASRLETFRHVELPIIFPGLLGAFLFSFLLAFNEYIRAFFLQGRYSTLPITLFSRINAGGIDTEMYGLAAVTVAITIAFLLVLIVVQRAATRRRGTV